MRGHRWPERRAEDRHLSAAGRDGRSKLLARSERGRALLTAPDSRAKAIPRPASRWVRLRELPVTFHLVEKTCFVFGPGSLPLVPDRARTQASRAGVVVSAQRLLLLTLPLHLSAQHEGKRGGEERRWGMEEKEGDLPQYGMQDRGAHGGGSMRRSVAERRRRGRRGRR